MKKSLEKPQIFHKTKVFSKTVIQFVIKLWNTILLSITNLLFNGPSLRKFIFAKKVFFCPLMKKSLEKSQIFHKTKVFSKTVIQFVIKLWNTIFLCITNLLF